MNPEEMALCQLATMVQSEAWPDNLDLLYSVAETPQNAVAGIGAVEEFIARRNYLAERPTIVGIHGFKHLAIDGPADVIAILGLNNVEKGYIRKINYPDAPLGLMAAIVPVRNWPWWFVMPLNAALRS